MGKGPENKTNSDAKRVEQNTQKFEVRKQQKEQNGQRVHVNKYPKINGQ